MHSIASHFSEGHLFDKAAPAYKELGGPIRGSTVGKSPTRGRIGKVAIVKFLFSDVQNIVVCIIIFDIFMHTPHHHQTLSKRKGVRVGKNIYKLK